MTCPCSASDGGVGDLNISVAVSISAASQFLDFSN